MKIRFLSKKQREQLKKTALSNNNQPSSAISPPSLKQPNNPNQHPKLQSHTSQQFGGDLHVSEQEESSGEMGEMGEMGGLRERSREKKKIKELPKPQFNKLEVEQVEQMKKKYLGLIPREKTKRFTENYREKFQFQWDEKEDTSKGALNEGAMQALRKLQQKKKNRDNDIIGKTWREKNIEEMNERDWRIFREDNQIYTRGGRVPHPFRQWHENSQLSRHLLQNLAKLKFQKPKPIQMQAIPIGLAQKDMIALAPTGQGKTLAFLIPIITKIQKLPRITAQNSEQGPYAIILVPSRQLAEQIFDEFNLITYNNIRAIQVIGGLQLDLQILEIQKGCDLLIGTPGRIKQLIDKNCLRLKQTFWAVIDEADKMISQNLIEDVEEILNAMGMDSRQSMVDYQQSETRKVINMFSATMLPEIQKLTRKYLVMPISVNIGEIGAGKKQIEQYIEILKENQKNEALGKILKDLPGPIIIFVKQRVKCEKLATFIQNRFKRTSCQYHGGKNQESRQAIIQSFRQGKFEVLVATDLGGRGLDIKGVSAAISYDAPKNISQFIHRAGRSGRAGVKGKAYTFLTNQDQGIYYDIRIFLQKNGFKVPDKLREHPASQVKPGTLQFVSRSKQVIFSIS